MPAGRGRGLAVGLKEGPTTGLSYSTVRLLADGSIVVNAGTSDMGQGARTIFAQIAAYELGAPIEWVTVVMGDTAVVPYDQQTSASRSSVLMGNAVLNGCRAVQAKLRAMAARLEGVDEGEVVVDAGEVRIGDRVLPIRDVLVRGLGRLGGEVIGVGEMRKEAEPEHPLGGTAAFYEFNCTAVEVSVDEETGDVTVERHVTASDVGKALHPGQVRGQDEGAAVMGLGHTLMEHYLFDGEGRIRNLGAIDYRIPTSMDLPKSMESLIVENADGPGPYGAKGMSEGALLCVAPAVARGRARRDRGRDPRPAAVARAGLARPAGAPILVRHAYPLDFAFDLPPDELLALVGGKAANLAVMLGPELGLPVPPGFVVTTEACRAYLAGGWPDGLDEELRERMAGVEAATGRRFGDPGEPAARQRPVRGAGLDARDDGHDPGPRAERRHDGGPRRGDRRRGLRGDLSATASGSCSATSSASTPCPRTRGRSSGSRSRPCSAPGTATGPSPTARREGIPDDLGTAVTVQAMVFGNLGADSGTGVAFTRNPATGEPVLYGDVLFDAQGEDVVAGTHRTEPIAVLDERLPEVAAALASTATRLEHHLRDLCDIEFTIERGRLWMLQVRVGKRSPQAALRIAVDMAEDPAFPLTRARGRERVAYLLSDPPTRTTGRSGYVLPLVTGLGASPGVASGEIVTTPGVGGGRRRGGPARDPRPRRDLARRRPRDGARRRDPHGPGWAREPRRGRRPWLGHPGGRRRGGAVGRRRRGRDRRRVSCTTATSITIDGGVGRGLRGRDPGTQRGRAAGGDPARLGARPGRADRGGRCGRRHGRRRPVGIAGPPGDAGRGHPAARDEGLRDDAGPGGGLAGLARRGPAAARPARSSTASRPRSPAPTG